MPWIKVWLHFVWSTKNREPLLTDEIRYKVFRHVRENAKKKDIHIDFINGYNDHVHCLISLGADQTLSKIMQLIKGESAFWINKNNLCKTKFGWQDEYFLAGLVIQCLRIHGIILLIRKFIIGQKVLMMNLKIF